MVSSTVVALIVLLANPGASAAEPIDPQHVYRLLRQDPPIQTRQEALDYLRSSSVDLVMLDMIMPQGIDGLETYRRILDIRPEQKTIIASGYAETERVKLAQELGAGA